MAMVLSRCVKKGELFFFKFLAQLLALDDDLTHFHKSRTKHKPDDDAKLSGSDRARCRNEFEFLRRLL